MSYRNARITFLHRVSILIPAPQQWHLPVLHGTMLDTLPSLLDMRSLSLRGISLPALLVPVPGMVLPWVMTLSSTAEEISLVFGIIALACNLGLPSPNTETWSGAFTKLTSGDVRSSSFGSSISVGREGQIFIAS